MPFTRDDIPRLTGAAVRDPDGERIGRIGLVYVDADDVVSWATVRSGFLGASESFLPLRDAVLEGRDVRVPFSRDLVLHAPHVDSAEELTAEQADRLHDHYAPSGGVEPLSDPQPDGGVDPSGIALTRSEERLQVGVRRVERGRVRLRRSIVTEPQTVTVVVSHEEAALVREPVTEAEAGAAPRGATEEEHVIVLHGDVVVTEKQVVPVDRVRVTRRQVSEEQEVVADVQQERIDVVGTDGTAR